MNKQQTNSQTNIKSNNMNTEDFEMDDIELQDEYKEPKTWTIIKALDRVLTLAYGCELSNNFWKECKRPMANQLHFI